MQLPEIAKNKSVTPAIIQFLESRARLTGLVREIYIARGWIKTTGYDEPHYQVTPLGAKMLHANK